MKVKTATRKNNRDFMEDVASEAIIPEAPMGLEIDTDSPSKLEIQKAIKALKNKKVGTDQLNAELFKTNCLIGIKQQSVTHRLMLEMMRNLKYYDF